MEVQAGRHRLRSDRRLLDRSDGVPIGALGTPSLLLQRLLFSGPALILLLAATPGVAQDSVIRVEERICPGCTIALEPVLDLGEMEGVGAINGLLTMARLHDGRFVVAHDPSEMVLFAEDGTPVRRLGRSGQGPGEFRYIQWARAKGRKLHVFDMDNRRWTVYREDLEPVRMTSFLTTGTNLKDLKVLDDSTVVINAIVRTPERVGFLLHILDGGGEIVSSIDEYGGGFNVRAPATLYARSLASAAEGGIWSAHYAEYRIDRWGLDGAHIESLTRETDWFPPGDGSYPWERNRLNPPAIVDIHDDGRGRLWILISVPSDEWEEAFREGTRGRWVLDDVARAHDTIIEVIDLHGRAVVARTRRDEVFSHFLGNGQLASFFMVDDLIPKVRIWKVQLNGFEPGGAPEVR